MNQTTLAHFSQRLLLLLAEAALRATVLAGLVGLTLWALRVGDSVHKLKAWTVVLWAALALPILSAVIPAVRVRISVSPVQAVSKTGAYSTPAVVRDDSSVPLAPEATLHAVPEPSIPVAKPLPQLDTISIVPWSLVALAAYLFTAVLLVTWLFTALALARRLRRKSDAVSDVLLLRLLEHCSSRMRLRCPPPVLESLSVAVPLNIGVIEPAIVLPAGWREWDESKLTAVLMHELSHVRRRDSLARLAVLLYRAIFWFNPLSWWLERHLAELAEQASDQEAIDCGFEPAYYAEVLMSFFTAMGRHKGRVAAQGIWMASGKHARQRIEKILSTPGSSAQSLSTQNLSSGHRSSENQGANSMKRHVMLGLWGLFPILIVSAAIRPHLIFAAQSSPQVAPPAQTPAPAAVPVPPVTAVEPPEPASVVEPKAPPQTPEPSAPVLAPEPTMVIPAPGIPGGIVSGVPGGIVTAIPGGVRGGIVTTIGPDGKVREMNVTGPLPPIPMIAGMQVFSRQRSAMDFAIVSGDWMTVNGSDDDRHAVEALRKKISGDFIWFIHDGNACIIHDPATVQAARQFYLQKDTPNSDAEAIRAQMEQLNQQQQKLEQEMEAVRVTVPADLNEKLQALEAQNKALGASANIQQLNQLMQALGDVQRQIGEAERGAGESERAIGEKMRQLGEQERELGRQEAEMVRDRSEIGISSHVVDLINHALANGTAKRLE